MSKTVPISVRVSHEDAEFIANLKIGNAVTPSDKVRSIIREARDRNDNIVNYEGWLKISRDSLDGLIQKIKTMELKQTQHSELISLFNDWIVESFAYAASAKHEIDEGKVELSQFEAGISERVFRLLESMARMGVTSSAPCYDPEIISKGLAPVLELINIINQRTEQEKVND